LTFSEYENKYSILLNGYLSSNIDTDEQDFIKAELTLCDNLISELMKPIYNEISPFKEVLDLPSSFKKNLINSLDKRKKFLKEKENEKIPKIKGLFQFVDYLHSNIESFNHYNDLIRELELLKAEKNKLNPEKNYKDKLQYNKVQAELESKFKILQDNTANLIKAKAKELNVCDFDNEPIYRFNGIEVEIFQLKRDFNDEDFSLLPLIFKVVFH
jgi:DNA repair exonuclease SbcCD ATPase subunit